MTCRATIDETEAAFVLGLDPSRLTADDVRSAHRRLARENHPDLGGDPDTFRRIQEAYERLRDSTVGTVRGSGSGTAASDSTTTIDGRPLSSLGNRDSSMPDCPSCVGRGYTSEFEDARRTPCRRCRGFGIVVAIPCKFCRGKGCVRCRQTGVYRLPKPGVCHGCRGVGWTRGGGKQVHHVCDDCRGTGQRTAFNPVIPRGAILR